MTAPVDGIRSALIVAAGQFTDPGLRRLRAPAVDARTLTDVLRDPGIGGFEVRTLLNEPAHVVNLAVEEFFADRQPGDLLVVHFSGHGVKDEDGELYFAASNTVLGRLGATAVAAEFVSRRMSRSRSRRVVLLLDCCYAGAFARGLVARAGGEMRIEQQFGGRGRAVITASSAVEYAFERGELADTRELAPSVFTSALVEGLQTGEADRDQDGLVGLDELYDYVYDKVRATTPNQTPGKWTFGVEGELYIARRARPVSVPAPLPPELQQAMESRVAGIRAGAVQELTGLLRGRHAGMALAARLALEQLTHDDSRTVATAATAALGGPASVASPEAARPVLSLSATIIDFGALRQHAQSPERRVRVGNTGGGSLNARAATSASWLKLRQAGDELVVAVDTSAAGAHEGTVTVDSDGGSAAIRVQARVEPALWHGTKAIATTDGGLVPASAEVSPSAEEPATHPDTGIVASADTISDNYSTKSDTGVSRHPGTGRRAPAAANPSTMPDATQPEAASSPSEALDRQGLIGSARPRNGRSGSDDSPAQAAAETTAVSSAPLAGPAAVGTMDSAPGGGPISTGQRAWSDPGSRGGPRPTRRHQHRTVGRPSTRTAWIQGHRLLVIALAGAVLAAAGVVPFVLTSSPVHQRSSTIYRRGSIVTADGVTVAESTPTNDIYKYQRKYPHGPEYAPVTGYDTLHSESGIEYYENSVLKDSNVTLTINSKAQAAAYNTLAALGKPGAVVALNPKTGAILAMASYPSYDPNVLATHDGPRLNQADRQLLADKAQPLLNRALQGTYAPGSTFKIVTSSALLTQSPNTTINTNFDSPTQLTLPQTTHVLNNNNGEVCGDGSGQAPLITAFAQSCDTTFGKIGMDLGAPTLNAMAEKFGVNDPDLKIPLPVAQSNYVIPPSEALTAFSAIGQYSDTVTPLQEAMFAAAFANGGTLMKPYLVQQVTTSNLSTAHTTTSSVLSQPVSAAVASSVGQMMRAVVQQPDGTAFNFDQSVEGIQIAGKTGTAETGQNTGLNDAAFTCFAPYANPSIAVGVIIEGGGYGATAAAPIAVQVIKAYLGTLGNH